MVSISTHETRKRPGRPRAAFVFALLGTLGVALAAIILIQPVREAFGLDPRTRTDDIAHVDLVEISVLRAKSPAAYGTSVAFADSPLGRLGAAVADLDLAAA